MVPVSGVCTEAVRAGRGVPVTAKVSVRNLGLLVFACGSVDRGTLASSSAVVAVA
jgi:hypothetical protein